MAFHADPAAEPPGLTREGAAHLAFPHEPCALYSVRGAKFIHDAVASAAKGAGCGRKQRRKKKEKKKKNQQGHFDHGHFEQQALPRTGNPKKSPAMQAFQQSLEKKVMNFNSMCPRVRAMPRKLGAGDGTEALPALSAPPALPALPALGELEDPRRGHSGGGSKECGTKTKTTETSHR